MTPHHRSQARVALLLAGLGAVPAAARAEDKPPSRDEMMELLKEQDSRQRAQGDWRSLIFMEQKEKNKVDVVYEAQVFRRSEDARFIFFFTQPKAEAGKGYLRIDKNLWMYDPNVGKWERRTERERIGGTNTRRSDLDDSRLAEEYEPSYDGSEKLGAFDTIRLKLTAKAGVDVAFPVMKLWLDAQTHNVLKRQEFALSGRLMRTAYFPKWKKMYSEMKKGDVWFPEELRFFDEVEKANSTHILIKSVELKPLDKNMFTKAWVESKSR